MEIAFFPTCVIDAVDPDAGLAAARVLSRTGAEVALAEDTTCCGQPAWNAGHAAAAADVARTTLHALDMADGPIVVPAGSCATMIRVFWRELFHLHGDDADQAAVERVASRTREFSEYLASQEPEQARHTDDTPTVYHRSCHMLRELGISAEPETLLEAAGSELRATEAQGRCCGFGGLFSVKLPEVSVAMADDVLDAAVAAGAEQIVGCDASCLMHLEGRSERRALGMRFRHLAEVLDAASSD